MQKNKKTARKILNRGITADARTLGVSRQHLTLVLKGERQSKSLMARYTALQEKKKEAAA